VTAGGWLPLRPAAARSGIAPWLAERGSLTARLRAHCTQFGLRRLCHGTGAAQADDPGCGGPRLWRREVLLLADGQPVVFARSVAARDVLRDSWRLLRGLGARPLGDAVFARPGVRRTPIRVRRLRRGDALQRAACRAAGLAADTELWARRSAFVHRGAAVWVTEVFLPALSTLRVS
jgi:chorismate--pyruvate lyase